MNFQTAIRSGFQNYTNFKGRSSRAEYWWWALFTVILSILLSSVNDSLGNLGSLVTLLPSIAVAIRRVHDVDRVGGLFWCQFIIWFWCCEAAIRAKIVLGHRHRLALIKQAS